MVDNIIDQQSAHAKDLAERRRATTQRYREKNREQIRAQSRPYTKAYRLANLEAVKAKKRAKYAADGEYDRRYAREWYARNAEASKVKHEAWLAANPGKRVEYETRRRAKKAGADGDHTIDDVLAIGEAQGWKCHWCSKSVRKRYHVDHIIPLSKGGGNGPRNLCITCQPCNQSKHAKDPIDWARQLGRLL
jgi:5-methylcytosine-specific restriction endonuclease McrA